MTTIGITQHIPSGTTPPTTLNSAGTTQNPPRVDCPVCLTEYEEEEVLRCSNGHVSSCAYCLSRIIRDNCTICRVNTFTVHRSPPRPPAPRTPTWLERLPSVLNEMTSPHNIGPRYHGMFITRNVEEPIEDGELTLRVWRAKYNNTGKKITLTSNREIKVYHREGRMEEYEVNTLRITKLTRTIKKSREEAEEFFTRRGETLGRRTWKINHGSNEHNEVWFGHIQGIFTNW